LAHNLQTFKHRSDDTYVACQQNKHARVIFGMQFERR